MTRSVTRFPFLAYAALVALPIAGAIGTAGAAPAPASVPLTIQLIHHGRLSYCRQFAIRPQDGRGTRIYQETSRAYLARTLLVRTSTGDAYELVPSTRTTGVVGVAKVLASGTLSVDLTVVYHHPSRPGSASGPVWRLKSDIRNGGLLRRTRGAWTLLARAASVSCENGSAL